MMEDSLVVYLEQINLYLEQVLANQVELLTRLQMYGRLILMGVASIIGVVVVVFVGRALWRLIRF